MKHTPVILRQPNIGLYIYQFCASFMPIYALYALMLRQHGGLSSGQISVLFGWWIFVGLVAEIPTSVWADRFTAKSALVYSSLLQILCFMCWLLAPSFWGYACGFTLWAIGGAFSSGTFQSYLYNYLKAQGTQKSYGKITGRLQAVSFAALTIAYVFVGIIGAKYMLALWLSLGTSLLSCLMVLRLPAIAPTLSPLLSGRILKTAFVQYRSSKQIRSTSLFIAGIGAIAIVAIEFVPIYYKALGVPIDAIAFLLGLGYALSAVFSWLSHRLEHKGNLVSMLALGLAGLVLLVSSYASRPLAVCGMILFIRLIRLAGLLQSVRLQHHINGRARATISSVATFGSSALGLVLILLYGWAATILGDIPSMRLLSLAVALVLVNYIITLRLTHHRDI